MKDTLILRLEMVQEIEDKIKIIQRNMKIAQDRQAAYADRRWWLLEFEEEDEMFLKVFPVKRVRRFNVKGKLKL